MNLKTLRLALTGLAASATLLGVSSPSMAADGTISFSGTITDSTCTVTSGGGGLNNFTVTLPTVSAGSLASLGKTAGQKQFSITVSCVNGATSSTFKNATIAFDQANVTSDGNLINTTTDKTGATNVAIQILNASGQPINLKTGANATTASPTGDGKSAVTPATATLNFTAQYIATAATAATAGPVTSSVGYTITYN